MSETSRGSVYWPNLAREVESSGDLLNVYDAKYRDIVYGIQGRTGIADNAGQFFDSLRREGDTDLLRGALASAFEDAAAHAPSWPAPATPRQPAVPPAPLAPPGALAAVATAPRAPMRRTAIAWGWIAAVVLMALLPPWTTRSGPLGYCWIVAPPHYAGAHIDEPRLGVEWIATTVIAAGLLFAWPFRSKP